MQAPSARTKLPMALNGIGRSSPTQNNIGTDAGSLMLTWKISSHPSTLAGSGGTFSGTETSCFRSGLPLSSPRSHATRIRCHKVVRVRPLSRTLSHICLICGWSSWPPSVAAPIHDMQMTSPFPPTRRISRFKLQVHLQPAKIGPICGCPVQLLNRQLNALDFGSTQRKHV